MNSLLHNSLADLAFQYFLVLYVACGVVGLLAGTVWIWLCDGTRDDDLVDNPPNLSDPYEIAFLAGGAAAVTRLVVFDLIEKGHVELSGTRRPLAFFAPGKMLRRCASVPALSELTIVQRAAWDWLATPRLPSHLFHRHIGLLNQVRPLCQIYVKPLETRRFLETVGHSRARTLVAWGMSAGIVGLGLYKLVTSVVAGEGESFSLILLMVVGLICTAINCRPVRLSDLGHRYLEHLSLEFGDWPRSTPMENRVRTSFGHGVPVRIHTLDAGTNRQIRVALFGTAAGHRGNHRGNSVVDDHRLAFDQSHEELSQMESSTQKREGAKMPS